MIQKGKLGARCMTALLAGIVVLGASYALAQIPVPGCQELTPTLTVRRASFRCKGGGEASCEVDKWQARGQFTMFSGPEDPFDPAAHKVQLIFSQVQGDLYQPVLPPGTFKGKGSSGRPTWVFRLPRRAPYVEGAEGWDKAKFRHVKLAPVAGAANRVRYSLRGRENDIEPFVVDTSTSPILLRETMIFSEPDEQGGEELLCVSYILTCQTYRSNKVLRCFSLINPSPSGAFLDITGGVLD